MFFTISKTPCKILLEQHTVGDWIFSTDLGWAVDRSQSGIRLEKGLGNVNCVLTSDGHDWQITTNALRRFPLWRSESGDTVSNLIVTDNEIYNPHSISHKDGRLQTHEGHLPTVGDEILVRRTAEEQICETLISQAEDIRDHDRPIIAPNTHGVDCALVRAVLDYSGIPYTSHGISDQTLDLSRLSGHRFRLYRQMLNDGSRHTQATGFNGDAFMSRNPMYVSLYLKKWNIDLTAEFDKAGSTYTRNSFDKNYRDKILKYTYPADPMSKLIDMLVNDFQAWHIDECLTWTPLADIRIMKTCLSIDPETAIDQCVNAGLSRALIKRLSPNRLDEIQRNHNGNEPV